MQCAECGAGVDQSERFCRACGASLEGITDVTAPAPAPPPPPPPVGMALPPPQIAPESGPSAVVVPEEPPLITPALDSDAVNLEDLAHPPADDVATVQLVAQPELHADASTDPTATTEIHIVPATDPYVSTTDELPALFDGGGDIAEYPTGREPFKLRLVLIFGLFGLIAAVMVAMADIVDIFTSTPVDGINQGTFLLDDFGTNLAIAGFVGGGVMVIGGIVACFGLRWGAGLAGGAGLALVGWTAMVLGLVETPIETSMAITRNPTTTEPFTLTVTRDLGYWLIVAVGGMGLIVFLFSLTQSGRGARRSLNPWVAALGAVAPLVLAAGPLIPVAGATFNDNFGIDGPIPPMEYFIGRLVQVGLVAVLGAVGLLLVRGWGLGLAAGAVSVGAWMWLASLGELGDNPIGLADRNLAAADTVPHGVTTVGAGFTLVMLIIAAAVAASMPQRPPSRR